MATEYATVSETLEETTESFGITMDAQICFFGRPSARLYQTGISNKLKVRKMPTGKAKDKLTK